MNTSTDRQSKRKHTTDHQSTTQCDDIPTMLRPCDNLSCHICLKAILSNEKGIISTVPTDRLRKLKPKTVESFKIKWDLTLKSNAFHFEFWDHLKSSSISSVEKKTMVTIE